MGERSLSNMFGLYISSLVISMVILQTTGNESPKCNQSDMLLAYLDVALDVINEAKKFHPICPVECVNRTSRPMDCEEVLRKGHNKSGVYTIWPKSRVTSDKSLDVFCDMDTDGGGWTVLQRRGDFSKPKDYFFKDWENYKNGFGNIKEDFWIGNDNIFALTSQRLYSIRFDLKAVDGEKRHALYDTFWIDDENNKYKLHIKGYSGNAGDSMIEIHNNQRFSTKDQDNDSHSGGSCAQAFKGGWWYNSCHSSNLNGLYLRGKHESSADGVSWKSWKGHYESLDTTEMKIRPKNFRKN